MNNVWTSIACQAPSAVRQARAKPLLHLFNGHARSMRVQCSPASWTVRSEAVHPALKSSFSTSSWLRAKNTAAVRPGGTASAEASLSKSPFPAKNATTQSTSSTPESASDGLPTSTLQPAQAVGSYTEGVVETNDEDGRLTWRDYDPEGGMPLPDGEVTPEQARAIFGEQVTDLDKANYILSVMYWRRMSGALIDSGFDFPRSSEVTREQAGRALEYVRSLDPEFDEQAAGGVWAEEETVRLRGEVMERSMKLGLYKREVEEVEEEEPEAQQGTQYGRDRSSQSALEKLRHENEAKWEREETERKAKEQQEELASLRAQRGPLQLAGGVQPSLSLATTGSGAVISAAQTKASLAAAKRKETLDYYRDQATIIKENVVPQISSLGRLAPAFLLLLATVGVSFLFASIYDPPPKSARMFPDTPPAVATLAGLTALLVAGFVAGRIPPLWRAYSKYFTIVPAYPWAVSLLGATFRHDHFTHLATNLIALWAFGAFLHDDIGRGAFLAVFVSSAAAGGFASLAYNVARKQWGSYIFGSSGAVLGVVAAACTLRPNGKINVAGYELPVAAWLLLAGYTTLEVVAAVRGVRTSIDHAGHLGGVLAGFLSAMYIRAQADERRRKEESKATNAVAL